MDSAKQMPVLFYMWMFMALANLGLPGMSGFVAESAVFYGSYSSWMEQAAVHAPAVQMDGSSSPASGVDLDCGIYVVAAEARCSTGKSKPLKWAGHLTDAFAWGKVLRLRYGRLDHAHGIRTIDRSQQLQPCRSEHHQQYHPAPNHQRSPTHRRLELAVTIRLFGNGDQLLQLLHRLHRYQLRWRLHILGVGAFDDSNT